MTAVNFPSSPSNGDTLTSGNTTYTYNSTKTRWDAVTTVNGIQLNSLSVGAEAAASGNGGIAYDNTSGEFTYTPPVTGDSLPSQTDNSGKFLTTNGTAASWATVSAGAGYAIGDGLELTGPVTTVAWPASPVLTATQVSSLSGKWLGGFVAASADYVVGGYVNLGGQVEVYNARTGAFIRTISPPTSNTSFGQTCSIDGTNLVVGAPGQRKAYIYNVETGALLHTLSGGLQFGANVEIKGNYALVAGQEIDLGVYNVTTGSLLYTITDPNTEGGSANSDYFAQYGLALTSSHIIAGAPYSDPNGLSNAGSLYIFNLSDGSLVAEKRGAIGGGFLGHNLSADGDLVGAYYNNTVVLYSISALVADSSSNPTRTITRAAGSATLFGYYGMSLSGNYIGIGATYSNTNGSGAGAAELYDVTDGSLVYSIEGAAAQDQMGYGVAVAPGVFAAGAPGTDSPTADSGSIGIYNGTVSSTSYLQPDSTIATTSYVDTSVSNLVDSSPAALNTLNELAAALGDDANFSTTVTNSIAAKAPLADPTFTGVPVAPTAAAGTNTTQLATTAFVAAANAAGGLPSQTDNTGKYLTTDGSTTSWATVSAGAGYAIGDGLELETVTASDWSTLPAATASIVGSVAGHQFGAYIASSNSHLAVLSRGPTNTFSVYNAQTGSFVRSITKPGGSNYNGSIGVSGTKIIFGDDGANAAYIFEATSGALLHNLSSTGSSLRGISSAISPTYAATKSLSSGNIDAYVDVHSVVTGNKLYTLTNPDIVPTGGSATFDDHYGSGLSISDSYLVVGAYQEEGAGGTTGSGAVYVYDTPTGTLLHTLTPTSPIPINSGNYGSCVSVDGDYIAVGSNNMNTVFIYSASTGSLLRTIAAPSGGAAFGRSVSVNGNYLLVGQPHSSSFAGSAFLFNITDGSLLHTIAPGYSTSQFGGAVVLAQSVIAIAGQFYDNGGSADVGMVDLYNTTSTTTSYLQPDSTIATTSSLAAKAPLAGPTFTGVPAAPTAALGTNTTQLATTAFVTEALGTVASGAGYEIGDGLELNSVSAVSWPASPNLISTINGSAASKQLGYNIAASADYVVAGYIDHDRVEVYNARTGAFLRSIICPDGTGHRFGKHGIDIDGTNLIVGAPGAGKAYIFDITNGSTLQTFSSSSVEFGIHVSIKGNYAAVADYHTSDSDWIGKFTVYNVTTGSQLYVVNNPNAGGGDAGDNFAKDGLDMTASYIVTAGWREDTGASGSGTAYVFDISNGTLLATVLNPNPVSNGFFGYGIAADGDYLGVYGGIVNNSNVYVYSLSALVANASASPIYTINNPSPDGNTSDQFGYASVSVAGTYMAVGAKSEDVGSGSSGSSYLYDLSDGSLLYTINGAAGDDNMGWASAAAPGVFVTGSPQNDSGGSNNGSIGIYNGTVSSTSYLQPDSTIATLADPTFTGTVTLPQTAEVSTALTSATGTVAHDLSNSALFVHSSISADFTANFTNVPTTDDRTTSVALVLVQGGTAYIPTALQIDGSAQTILWQGSAAPTGTASKHDIVSFSLIRSGGAWTVVGSLTTYGA